jgi:3,4-dihydroxy 2-butanone 4-phosphate synthase/GTP cyclohydrolase II
MMRIFADETTGADHIVLTKGDLTSPEPVLTRIHVLDPLQDVLGITQREDAGDLPAAMRLIAEEGRGVVVLFRDLERQLPQADEAGSHVLRQYGLGAQILATLGLHDLILLTNAAPLKVVGLDAYGLSIHSTRPIPKG